MKFALMKFVVILILLILFASSICSCILCENFESNILPSNEKQQMKNLSDNIEDRHPIYSLPYDIDMEDKYKKAYYYEKNNKEYQDDLISLLTNCLKGIPTFENQPWEKTINSHVKGFYNIAYQNILKRLNTKNIQIVHDILKQYKNNGDNSYLLDIDMILYEDNKIHGKHVNFIVFTDYNNTIVKYVNVVGIVPEDRIFIHPIEPLQTPSNSNNIYQSL